MVKKENEKWLADRKGEVARTVIDSYSRKEQKWYMDRGKLLVRKEGILKVVTKLKRTGVY